MKGVGGLRAKAKSLKRGLAIWLVGVLSMLLLVDAWLSYSDALNAANQAYDRSLSASLKGIAERVYATEQEIVVDIPYSALALFEAGSSDRVFYSIGLVGEEPITGYDGLPQPGNLQPNTAVFYDGEYRGQAIRLGAMLKPLYRTEFPKPVILVVGETTNSRQEVVHHLFLREIGRKALLAAVALGAALLATILAVRPIETLGEAIRRRPDDDLTPVDAANVPQEVAPLVDAINLHMERIAKMVEARRRFIADAAHQLRTPLAVLNTQADYALRQAQIAEMRPAVEALHDSLRGAIRLTNQLLTLSHAESASGLLGQRQTVDLSAVVREVVVDLLPLAGSKRIDLGFEGGGDPVWVMGSAVLLRELAVNLIDNALRYTPAGGVVTAAVDGLPDTPPLARLRVTDSGPGIPEENRSQVFMRFFRLNPTDHTGSGLGLSIVREIVLAHDGSVTLGDGLDGRGLAVDVRLPLAGVPATSA